MVNWFGFAVSADASYLRPESVPRGATVGVVAVSRGKDRKSVSINVYWLLAIGAGSPNKPLAYQFISHCMRPYMDKLLTLRGAIGCRN